MREGWRGTRTCFLLFIREETKERRIFLDFTTRTSTYVCVSHRDTKSDCKRVCVKDVFPHLYTWCPKISTFWDVFPQKTWNRACVSPWKYQNGKGPWLSFQLPSPIVLGNAYVLKTCFFCVSSRLKSVAVFLAQAHPNRCFCQQLLRFWDQKLRKRHAVGKTELSKITWQLPKKSRQTLTQKNKHTTTDLT